MCTHDVGDFPTTQAFLSFVRQYRFNFLQNTDFEFGSIAKYFDLCFHFYGKHQKGQRPIHYAEALLVLKFSIADQLIITSLALDVQFKLILSSAIPSCSPAWHSGEDLSYNLFLFTVGFFTPLTIIILRFRLLQA